MHPSKKEVKQGILGVRLEQIHQVGGGSFPLRSHKARLSGKPLSLVPGKVVFGISYHGSRQESASRGGTLGRFLVRGTE